MPFELPFDPTALPRESEAATRLRHGSVEWGTAAPEPIRGEIVALDPELTGVHAPVDDANRFDDRYDDQPIHVTRIEDGVLFGQGFLVCSATRPTVSRERLYLVSRKRVGELLPHLQRLEVERGPLYLVGANGGSRNFYHWLFQCVTSTELLQRVAFNRGQDCRLVLPPLQAAQQRTLELLGVRPDRCVTLGPREYLYDVPLMYTNALHQRFTFQPSPRLRALLEPLRDRALAARVGALPTRFYVSRRDSESRRLENEHELIAALENIGYQELVLSDLSVEQQISAFANAEDIVAPHGAGLVHLLFAPRGCRVLEILPENHQFAFFFRIAQMRGLRYSAVLSRVASTDAVRVDESSILRADIGRVLRELGRDSAS